MWYLSSNINNGYPYNTEFIGIISSIWTAGVHNTPTEWRIDTTGQINNGYPFNYYMTEWIGEGGGGEEGDGDIIDTSGHTRQTRAATHGTHDTLTSSKHAFDTTISGLSAVVAASCNVYVMNAGQFLQMKSLITSAVLGVGSTIIDFLANLSGTNIFDGFVMARAYPFNIAPSGTLQPLKVYGMDITSQGTFYTTNDTTINLDFGSVSMGISEAWHISKNQYQIYLPFVGVMDFKPVNNSDLYLSANVDLLEGIITYTLKDSGSEIILIASGNIGINVPINLAQAIQARNIKANIIGMATNMISQFNSVGSKIGSIATAGGTGMKGKKNAANRAAASDISGGGDLLGGVSSPLVDFATPKENNPTFQVIFSGDDNTIASLDMQARIIVHKVQSFNDANGYPEQIGLNNSKYVDNLNSYQSSDIIKCVNYVPASDMATDAEKQEIKRLMEAGVLK